MITLEEAINASINHGESVQFISKDLNTPNAVMILWGDCAPQNTVFYSSIEEYIEKTESLCNNKWAYKRGMTVTDAIHALVRRDYRVSHLAKTEIEECDGAMFAVEKAYGGDTELFNSADELIAFAKGKE